MRKIFHSSFLIGLIASLIVSTIVSTAYMPHARAEAITCDLDLPAGWSMISLPVRPSNKTLSNLFPGAVVVYGYKSGVGYVRVTSQQELEVGKGYWILLAQNKTYTLNGESIQEYTLGVGDRWYMIGGCSSEAEASIDNGNIAVIYRYVQGIGYQRVLQSEHIEPGVGYWILLANTNNQAQLRVEGEGGVLTCTDEDHDGYAIQGGSCGPIDCDDTDRDIHPGALEICGDGIDQDCNGEDLACIVPELPPNPADVAPEVDQTVATTMDAATRFLYTGSNPIQRGMAHGTLEPTRVAVLCGRVITRNGDPLPGVQITILNHPEYGETLSREDGMFDMAVNGGGFLTVCYTKKDYLSAQRQINVPWQDYAWLPDVALVPLDNKVTVVDFSEPIQVARGNPVTDADGTRQATLLFSQGTMAEMVLPDGSTQPLASLSVRATEYSVGENGQKAMPAELPPASAYTYCVEFTADEALAAGATDVLFDQPVYTYVEDFIGFPVGSAVPTGYYDRQKGQWIASENGRVIKVLSMTSGLADLDTDGDEAPDDSATLAALGITDTERQRLATLYAPDQSLWRVPVNHFTPWDCNWPYGPPMDAERPNPPQLDPWDPEDDPCENSGSSIIECQNQILGERVPLTGIPFTLNYRSGRVSGHRPSYTLDIPLSGDSVPASLVRIHLEIEVAGRKFSETFYPPAPNLSYTFVWDGKDAYGRSLQGKQPISGRIGYVYNLVYYPVRSDVRRSFARVQGRSGSGGMVLTGGRPIQIILWQDWKGSIGTLHAQVLGGWTLDMHHTYDTVGQVLYLGNGSRRNAGGLITPVIDTVAGNGIQGYGGDGGLATKAKLSNPYNASVAPDGSIYIADRDNDCIRRVGPDGIITTVAGNGIQGFSGDGGPATEAQLWSPYHVSVASDGSLYIADIGNYRIRRVGPDGIITTVAGNGIQGFSGDGGPAIDAQLSSHCVIFAAPDGSSVYVADSNNHRIRCVGSDGIITTVAGNGTPGFSGNGGPATEAKLTYPYGVSVAPDGNLYIADTYNNRIRRVGPDGIITTVAGNGTPGFSGAGGPATEAQLRKPYGVSVAPDGSLYIADTYNNRIRRVGPDGIITTVAGNGTCGFSGDRGPATETQLWYPHGVSVAPDGSVYIADLGNERIRRLSSAFPVFSLGDIIIPSEDGSELYHFDWRGRHLRTLNALTGGVIYRFIYDDAGLLTAVEDRDGHVTTIERDSAGNPIAIVAPFGQRTTLSIDANGYLASISNPAGEANQFEYTTGGLLTEMTDPRDNTYNYTYDDLGLLIKAEDPAGGFKELARTKLERTETIRGGYEVTLTTAMGRTTTYRVEQLSTGEKRLVNTFGCCGSNEALISTDGTRTTTFADGTVVTEVDAPDPRWGMLAPMLQKDTITTPGGLQYVVEGSRTVALAEPDNLMSLTSLTEMIDVNGRTYTVSYNASQRLWTSESPLGRKRFTWLDQHGRPEKYQVEGLLPVEFTYDTDGRLQTMTDGTGADARVYELGYNTDGYTETITDPLSRTGSFHYDSTGRMIRQIFPDGREIIYNYDENGNVISITPPGRPDHEFTYTPIDLQENYIPPDVGADTNLTHSDYNLDGKIDLVTRPDGVSIDLQYNAGGRLSAMVILGWQVNFQYDPNTKQLVSISSPDGGVLSYNWDGMLFTNTTWSGDVSGSIQRTYNNDMRLVNLVVNGTHNIDFAYDDDGLLVQSGELTLNRDPQNGLVLGTTLDQISSTRSYNNFGELETYQASFSGAPIFKTRYVHDALGRIIERTETIDGVTTVYTYMYDNAGRLHEVRKDGATISIYGYDSNGNRTAYTNQNGNVSTGTYDNQDRMLKYGDATYTYTENGALRTRTVNGQTTTYTYDILGNLTKVNLSDGTEITYIVDGVNRQIGKKVNGSLVQGFLYQDSINPVAELDGTGNIISLFIYSSRINLPDYMIKGGIAYRFIADHLGSLRLVVNAATGEIVQQMDYDEFGSVLQDTNPGFQPFGFAGGLYELTTGLVRFGARDYDAKTGRWTAKDPVFFRGASTNLYGYVLSDPVNYADLEGMKLWYANKASEREFKDDIQIIMSTQKGRELLRLLHGSKTTFYIRRKLLPTKQGQVGIATAYVDPHTRGRICTEQDWQEASTTRTLAHELGHLAQQLTGYTRGVTAQITPCVRPGEKYRRLQWVPRREIENIKDWENPIMTPFEKLTRLSYQ